MKRNMLIFLILFGIIILSLSCVSASENNDTLIQHNSPDSIDNSENLKVETSANDVNQANEYINSENIASDDCSNNQMTNDIDDDLAKIESKNLLKTDINIHVYGPDLKGLQGHIDDTSAGSTFDFFHDFYTINNKLIIKVSKDIIIDGHGHTIDLTGSSKHDHYFKITNGLSPLKISDSSMDTIRMMMREAQSFLKVQESVQ